MIHLMQFDRGCQIRSRLAGCREVILTAMCSAEFNPIGRDLVVRVKKYDYCDGYKKHWAVYVYKRKSGRVVWGVHVIEEGCIGKSMIQQVVFALRHVVVMLICQERRFSLAYVSSMAENMLKLSGVIVCGKEDGNNE